MRWLKRIFVVIAGLCLFTAGSIYWITSRQGLPSTPYTKAKIVTDANGIPTIEASDWPQLIEAQGFVVASQRLFQMDLIRRKAGGRLAEWFGAAAFAHDFSVQREDRIAIARAAAASLPDEEREYCDRYADGVNQFMTENPSRVGIEYLLLQVQPEPWTCADSLLVLLEMADVLSSSADHEAENAAWRRNLTPEWQDFLFPVDHPWNHPYFGEPLRDRPVLPPASQFLARKPLEPGKSAAVRYVDPDPVGSNNWAWRGPTGAFLANDPHLGNAVPSIWYAMRLRISKKEWVVGVSIPGLPGIVIGMNPSLAWAFTNSGEDVDDFLYETPDDSLQQKTFEIKVKGEKEPRRVTGTFSKHGPVAERAHLGSGLYARQWLPLKAGMLRLPTVQFMQTKDLAQFDRAVDSMVVPSQNVLVMDYQGNMGYRMSGTGVTRHASGRFPQPAEVGEWDGLQPPTSRLRQYYKDEGNQVRFLASANERLWTDAYGGQWASDDRKDRIVRYLSARQDFIREDMEKLQVDTEGRFRQQLMRWIADKAGVSAGPAAAFAQTFKVWDGNSRTNPELFKASTLAEDSLIRMLLGRIQDSFKDQDDRQVPYGWYMRRAWVLTTLEAAGDQGFLPFGLTAEEVAQRLLSVVMEARGKTPAYPESNRWRGQHAFVGRLPILGDLFALKEIPQWGAPDLVDAEQPTFGPSTRLVWDLHKPWESTWGFPIGQSGHVGSSHYKDLQALWQKNQRLKVFDDGEEWEFVGRAR